ncbi:DUF6625 family protein [Avibacterium avium]|uniref:Uncharacterized protein n=1 Tax=Avibacterium avium TaxID=751 RepID=A0A379ARY0_AVIAV|nr:DUF6625 family protein [Avibacterium avium]SUB23863.1 Uncharacterised protein [Avibacterium avium]
MKAYKKINMIIPYFGQFPNYFPLFLRSCERNPSITWTIISDNKTSYKYPKNVNFVFMTFHDLKDKVQSLFEFPIYLETPYKLCDYKPAYGYIFKDLITDFDYWGYCDLDVIYGDIRKFISEEILKFKKIFLLGHFSLIKNEDMFNKMFMRNEFYREVFSNKDPYNFDETFLDKPNVNDIFEKNGFPVYKKNFSADIYTKSSDFVLDHGNGICEMKKNSFFVWSDGKLSRYIKEKDHIFKEEFMYIHLQKRKMNININMNNPIKIFKLIPNAFDDLEIKENDIYESFDKVEKKHFNLQYVKVRYNNLLVKIKRIFKRSK